MTQWKLLFVDDSDLDVMLAVRAIRQAGKELVHRRVDTAAEFRAALDGERWDAVICDHQMPEFDALSALRLLRHSGRDIPFIIVSGVIPDELAIEAMRDGARDFVGKDKLIRLAPAIERELAEARNRALLRQTQNSVDRLMHYDMLTGVANADALINTLRSLTGAAGGTRPFALLLIEFKRFRKIAQGLGMVAANRALRGAAMRLAGLAGTGGTAARVGAERFALVLPDARDAAGVDAAFRRVRDAFVQPLDVNGQVVHLACAIGAALYPEHARDPGILLQAAESALAVAGSGNVSERLYVAGMGATAQHSLIVESALHRAVTQREFALHYQPQVDIDSGRIIGVEALLRWQNPERSHMSPADFVPILEESGLMLGVGEWVIAEAARQWAYWRAAGLPPLRMAINLSAVQIHQPDFAGNVARLLAEAEVDPRCFEFELTESMAMGNEEDVIATLVKLKALGASLAIDDFGTGYSSLGYLQHFPVDRLKIDQGFVRGGAEGLGIAGAIVALGRSLGLAVTAEGVETAEHIERVRGIGCTEAQGFIYARPMPPQIFADFHGPNGAARQ